MQIYEKIATSANCVLECVAPDCRFWILGYFFYFCQIVFILNQMRRLIFFLGFLAALMTACEENSIVDVSGTKGEVVISLSSSELGASRIRTRSEEVDVPEIDDFMVEIYSSAGIRLYRDTYANSSGKSILLNSGEYRLLAQHGDSAGVGFSSVWFAADCNFQVRPQTAETVEAVARMAKVKAAVKYGPQIALNYSDFYVELKGEGTKPLTFSKDETRAGYMPAGTITPLIYATVDGELKYFEASSCECAPGDFVTFNVDTKPLIGSLAVSVVVDNGVELIEKELSIGSAMLPKDAPSITVSGFDGGSTLTFTEAVASPLVASGMKADIVAAGKIASCVLGFTPESAAQLDVDEAVDLCTVDEVTAGKLKAAGFDWLTVAGGRLAYVDFTGLASRIINSHCDPDALKNVSFSLTVTDALSRTVSTEQYSVNEISPELSFVLNDWNAYAKRIDHISASAVTGNPERLQLQYFEGSRWNPVESVSNSGNNVYFKPIKGLNPNTEYKVRAIYNGNENFAIERNVTTENDAQIGNSGFEEWNTQTHTLNYFGKLYVDWYLPWSDAASSWWDVNSKLTMPNRKYGTTTQNQICFPMVSYVETDVNQGNRSAIVYTVHVHDGLAGMDKCYPGELFIGKADSNGNHSSEGHSFNSRPSKIRFAYKYEPLNGETGYVKVTVSSEDGSVIAVAERTDIMKTDSWSVFEVPELEYSDITKKASSIYISFKSSSSDNPSYNETSIVLANNSSYSNCHIGSRLYIDDLRLIYE